MTAFSVKVGDAEYDVDAPDEKTAWKWANATHFKAVKSEGQAVKPPTPFKSSGETKLSGGEEILANPFLRAGVGALKPVVGIGQLGLNAVGQGEGINRSMQDLSQATTKARNYVGSEGVDLADMAGQAAGMAIPLGMMGKTTTGLQRIGQGALAGGVAGASEPVSDPNNYWSTKAGQVALGVGAGAAVPAAWEGTKAVGRGVRNVVQPYMGEWGADRAAGRLLNSVAGDRQPQVLQNLQNPQTIVPGSNPTAGQAAVPAGSAEFSALQQIAAQKAPSKYGTAGIEGDQNQARIAALKTISKSPEDLYNAEMARTASTQPVREAALQNANIAGVKGPQLAEAIASKRADSAGAVEDVRRLAIAKQLADDTAQSGRGRLGADSQPIGMPRQGAKYSYGAELEALADRKMGEAANLSSQRGAEARFLEMQKDSLSAHGLSPLEGKSVANRISGTMSQPGLRASDVVQKVLGNVKDKIQSLTNEHGVIDARDLYTIRKEIGNTIQTYSKETGNWDKRLTGKLEANVQKYIDDAIEGAGGAGWKDYLKSYASQSQKIGQMKAGQELEQKLVPALSEDAKQKAASYANALRETAPDVAETFTARQSKTLGSVKSDLERDALMKTLAREGNPAAMERIGAAVPEMSPTGMFNPKISFTRGVYNRITGHATDRILSDLAKNMDNPQKIAEMMKKATPMERQVLVEQLLRYTGPAAVSQEQR
jgi:hypothetical protein